MPTCSGCGLWFRVEGRQQLPETIPMQVNCERTMSLYDIAEREASYNFSSLLAQVGSLPPSIDDTVGVQVAVFLP